MEPEASNSPKQAEETQSERRNSSRTWHIPEERTKNGRPHTVPLSVPAMAILKTIPVIHERFLFPARGKTKTCFSGFGKCKERLDTRLDINPWRLHDLHRTAATGMAQLQVPPHIVERVLNHASGQLGGVAGIYNRFQYLDEMRGALNRWGEYVENLKDGDI